MKPILVHVHIFYLDQIDFIINHLQNITKPYVLYVTMIEKNEEIEQKIKNLKPDANIIQIENRGYDVWPFIYIINHVDLDNFSYIIKLHTKRKSSYIPTNLGNGYKMCLDFWRKSAYAFLESKKVFNKAIKSFEKHPKLGMTATKNLIHDNPNHVLVMDFAKKFYPQYIYGLNKFNFVAGTMFICRPGIMKNIQKMHIKSDLFDAPNSNHTTQFAHVMERTFGEAVYFSGYYIADKFSNVFKKIHLKITPYLIHYLLKIKRFFYRTEKKKYIKTIKIFKLPVYRIKIN